MKSMHSWFGPEVWKPLLPAALAVALLFGASVRGFTQGKVMLQNYQPITMPFGTPLGPDGALAGQPIPTDGPLPSGVFLVVGLYAGTSSASLSLYTSVVLNPAGGAGQPDGMIPPTRATLPWGAQLTYMQLKLWDAAYASFEAQQASGGGYYATTEMFTMTPGTSIAYPSVVNGGGSTWSGQFYWPLTPPNYIFISTQPLSQAVVQGATAGFSVGAFLTCGCGSLAYQWYFNGAPIPGAVGSSYQIANVQSTNAGIYSVSVYSLVAPMVSSLPATLTVLVPPVVSARPSGQTAEVGDQVGIKAEAVGDRPMGYRWFFNGATPVGDFITNSELRLPNVQFADSGAYTVIVTNIAGAATSPPAMLSVVERVPRRSVPGLILIGSPGTQLMLDRTHAITPSANWVTFDTVLLTNSAQWYFDVAEPALAQWFYRGWHTDTAIQPPTLQPYVVPALTLTGAAGANFRIDGINRVGPTDAWVRLATVTLTNSPQVYFDTSAPYQPPRLYRVVAIP